MEGHIMANFLLMTDASTGHVVPCTPIVRELEARGHRVIWITGRQYKERVESSGATFFPLPKQVDRGELDWYDFLPRLKELKGIAQIKYIIKHIHLDGCVPIIQSIGAILSDFRADVFISDTVGFALAFKGEIEGVPGACISLLPLSLPSRDTAPVGLGLLPGKNTITRTRNRLLDYFTQHILFRDVTAYANRVRQTLGLESLSSPFFNAMWKIPDLILHTSTASFEYPRSDLPKNVHFIGPILPDPDGAFQPPHWWSDLKGSRRVILVNQGTVATVLDDLILPTIQGLKDEELLVVAVPVKDGQLEKLPANVRAEPFIPFDHLFPYVDVMVTNGGYGATQFALAHGIPLVVSGETEDKREVAARVQWSGAGINLRKQRPSPKEVRDAVKQVLGNPVYREDAKRLQTDFAEHDAPTRAAQLLELLASGELHRRDMVSERYRRIHSQD
jgi:MGT family glycosyltransferase